MPGVLPMKVIKVGSSNSQNRIAQACDRCRAKKIKCNGEVPACSQCRSVGFECKTSDKLSRKAFPRGYTETLEERVRILEGEIKELKDLLDDKDEKIDLLSKVRTFAGSRLPSLASQSSQSSTDGHSLSIDSNDEVFDVLQGPRSPRPKYGEEVMYRGGSSNTAFLDALKRRLDGVFQLQATVLRSNSRPESTSRQAPPRSEPPRVVSDQLVSIYFQQWEPLLPILQRQAFLRLYSESAASSTPENPCFVTQLNLVLALATLSSGCHFELLPYFESQWTSALSSIVHTVDISTLQCLMLAELYYLEQGHHDQLVYYHILAVGLSVRLGLYQRQSELQLPLQMARIRIQLFWTLQTIDSFTAATLGLPRFINDSIVETEDPAWMLITLNSHEFDPVSQAAGESEPSSATALFQASEVLSRVLQHLYPAGKTSTISIRRIQSLDDLLEKWRDDLAPILRLDFEGDKPSTRAVSSRSPLLALAYFYIKSLIHRPSAISAPNRYATASKIALSESSKRIVQLVQLLKDRDMGFTLPFTREDVLLSAGFGLALRGVDFDLGTSPFQDHQPWFVAAQSLLVESGSLNGAALEAVAVAVFSSVKPLAAPRSLQQDWVPAAAFPLPLDGTAGGAGTDPAWQLQAPAKIPLSHRPEALVQPGRAEQTPPSKPSVPRPVFQLPLASASYHALPHFDYFSVDTSSSPYQDDILSAQVAPSWDLLSPPLEHPLTAPLTSCAPSISHPDGASPVYLAADPNRFAPSPFSSSPATAHSFELCLPTAASSIGGMATPTSQLEDFSGAAQRTHSVFGASNASVASADELGNLDVGPEWLVPDGLAAFEGMTGEEALGALQVDESGSSM